MENRTGRAGFRIGDVDIANITVFAPLAGFSNLPLRLLAKEAGCALVCSEMISARGLTQDSGKTLRLMDSTPLEKPLSVQIFGAEPSVMASAAAIVQACGADIVDINFGCPVKKILKSGSGAALMKQPVLAGEILRAVRKAVTIPVTVKIRSGWDSTGDQAEEIARIAQDSGVNALTLHPRTVGQGFSGKADWTLIRRIKSILDIPVIGNGDIVQPEDALRMARETGCDGIMIGRSAIGRPWIFSQVLALFRNEKMPVIDSLLRLNAMIRYLDASFDHLGDRQAALMMRSRLGWFVKGLPGAGKFRQSIKHIASRKEAMELIMDFRNGNIQ